jgi:hypothetical protein
LDSDEIVTALFTPNDKVTELTVNIVVAPIEAASDLIKVTMKVGPDTTRTAGHIITKDTSVTGPG